MIVKRFEKIGKISKPYFTQHNEERVDNKLGKLRKKIEDEIGGETPYDLYHMIADQAKRIDVLESIIKKLDPKCVLKPKYSVTKSKKLYADVSDRINKLSDIIEGEK